MTNSNRFHKQKSLIVIPFGLPLEWSCDYEVQTARLLSKNNTVIAFLINEGVSLKCWFIKPRSLVKRKSNLFVFRPIYILPLQRLRFIQKMNYILSSLQLLLFVRIVTGGAKLQKILWIFTSQLDINILIFSRKFFKLYDCVDVVPPADTRSAALEHEIIRKADIMFVNSESLYQHHLGHHPSLHRVMYGFALSEFTRHTKSFCPADLRSIPQPIISYIGNINSRLDIQLLSKTVSSMPNHSFVFVGHVDLNYDRCHAKIFLKEWMGLIAHRNVYVLGKKNRYEIPAYIRYSDVCLIPFDTNQIRVRLSMPMKTMEYFYEEKPVVTTPIRELEFLEPLVTIVRTNNEAVRAIRQLTVNPWPKAHKRKQKSVAIINSWPRKISAIHSMLKRSGIHIQ